MKKFVFFFFTLSLNNLIYAQDKLPSFSKIDKAGLQMKDCSFDAGAEAVQLIDIAETRSVQQDDNTISFRFTLDFNTMKE